VFDEDDGIVIAQNGLHQTFDVVRRGRQRYLQSGNVHEEGVEGIRVMRTGASYAAAHRPHHDRNFELSNRDVVDGRSLLDNFADRFQHKIEEDDIDNGMASGERGSNAQTGLTPFSDRRIAYPLSAELSPQAAALLEVSTPRADSLTHVEDVRIAPHLFADRFDSSFRVSDQSLLVGWLPGFSSGRSSYSTHFSRSGAWLEKTWSRAMLMPTIQR
jgi:hypothetical protein